jgi:hypothetical protein
MDETGWPCMKISPLVGESNPAIIRSKVVFPQPLGPRMVKTDSFGKLKLAVLTASTSPKRLDTFWSSTIGDRSFTIPAFIGRYWILDTRHWLLETGCSILDTA